MKLHFLLLLPTLSSAFVVKPGVSRRKSCGVLFSEAEDEEDKGLVLDGLDKEMNKVSSDNLFGAIDYLAEARKRAEQKSASNNAGADDKEWQVLADEKKQKFGAIDDWENSQKEAGNTDSQILMFTEPAPGEDDEDCDGSDPKLLLF
jgi:hypothetical protein